MRFSDYWKLLQKTEQEYLIKSSDKLTRKELEEVQRVVSEMRKRGRSASTIIKYLQDHNSKLAEKYKAERAFWTEVKRSDTKEVLEAAGDLDLDTFRVLLSPNACETCRKKTQNGRKVIKASDIRKGEAEVPPYHPNCYCVIVPR